MKRLCVALLASMMVLGPALAQTACETKAVGSDGRPLVGAAKNSFLQKCKREACEPKAVDKNGKPLVGAAKASFMKKCEAGA